MRYEFRHFDWILCGAVLGAVAIGFLAIASVDLSRGVGFYLLGRQSLALGIGSIVALLLGTVHPEFYRATSRMWYGIGLLLLGAVLVVGATIRSTKGWFVLGGFSFQPLEFVKIALLLTLARVIDRRGRVFTSALFFFGTALVAILPMALVMLQPDLGGSLVLAALWFLLVLIVGTRRSFVLLLLGTVMVIGVVGWVGILKPYQKERFVSFINPGKDPLGAGYNVQQSIIAVGSGKFWGRGFGYGSQNQLSFLPERQTDFVFSVVGEELGFVGVLALFICYGIIGWRLVRIAGSCRDDFTQPVIMGALGLWLVQIVVNVGGATGILPLTGIALPFVSYGGSSLVMNLVLVGIVQSIASHQV